MWRNKSSKYGFKTFILEHCAGTGKLDAGTSLSSLPCGLDVSTATATATANLNRMLGGQQIAATKYPW